jgi:hypothetical protein
MLVDSADRDAVTAPNGALGYLASDRRVRAEPKVCQPETSRSTSR